MLVFDVLSVRVFHGFHFALLVPAPGLLFLVSRRSWGTSLRLRSLRLRSFRHIFSRFRCLGMFLGCSWARVRAMRPIEKR